MWKKNSKQRPPFCWFSFTLKYFISNWINCISATNTVPPAGLFSDFSVYPCLAFTHQHLQSDCMVPFSSVYVCNGWGSKEEATGSSRGRRMKIQEQSVEVNGDFLMRVVHQANRGSCVISPFWVDHLQNDFESVNDQMKENHRVLELLWPKSKRCKRSCVHTVTFVTSRCPVGKVAV